ncbi:ATP-dependent endonuclease [Asticcacaulis sp.]|uniref:ATP-dependent nuclease n=1 Tax=Asticcacaulis sp. TaxID=1872648 RepID=UPI00261124F4|nr:ATP-binding protein [Asticcacaulis sp.]
MPNKLKITQIQFKVGTDWDNNPLKLECNNVTILVGPNNSGKSQTLREIEGRCSGGNIQSFLLDDVQISMPETAESIDEMMQIFRSEAREGQATSPNHVWYSRPKIRNNENELHIQIPNDAFKIWLQSKSTQQIREYFIRFFTVRLDGRSRFELVDPKPTGPLDRYPENLLWHLFNTDNQRKSVRDFTKEAFGKFFVIDPTGMTKFRVRLSDREPISDAEEQALDSSSRDFHANAPVIQSLGDGVQASVGLVAAVLSLPDRIILIDEPEAFLHPTLAKRVGRLLAKAVRDRDASLIVATHSSELLLGCMQSVPNLRIVRLTYAGGVGGARALDAIEVQRLMNDPLLRSAHALRALFHRGAVVCEADADRAFYEEINTRLSTENRGLQDCIFMNAQNWQTIPRLVQPLRKFGVPALAIFDFDVLMSEGFEALWPMVDLVGIELQTLQNERVTVMDAMKSVGRKKCKERGIEALAKEKQSIAYNLLSRFSEFGILFVPVGVLECWLEKLLPGPISKQNWLFTIFKKMGSDPDSENYITASTDDVWGFLELARNWIDNPKRRGMPI